MRDAWAYYLRVIRHAIPGSLSSASTWSLVAFGLGLPLSIYLFGENGGLSPGAIFWLSWSTVAAVVVIRLALAALWVNQEDSKAARLATDELKSIKDHQRKADILCDVRKSVIYRMNLVVSNDGDALVWCAEHDAWLDDVYGRVEREVSNADAHAIFYIGDASSLPVENGISPDHAAKMRWLRHFSNKLAETIDAYRTAALRCSGLTSPGN